MQKIQEILKEYKYRIEIHAHTSPVSKCGHVTAAETVQRYRTAGCDALVITNHLCPPWLEGNPSVRAAEYISDYEAAVVEGKKIGINVIFGMEIRFCENDNDYLVYGIAPQDTEKAIFYIDKGITVFHREFKNDKNLILQAHPFRDKMTLVSPCDIDGIESFNLHPKHNSRVALAAKYAHEHNMTVSCGTDFHDPGFEALALLRSKNLPYDSYDVAELLKSRDCLFDISGHIVFPYGN